MNILITGGLGFIGINTALRFSDKHNIVLFDNLSKAGSIKNISIAISNGMQFIVGDLRSYNDIDRVCEQTKFDVVFHFAAQTAVTVSTDNPMFDFENNAVGTFNLLESVRKRCPNAKLIYSSTNKVYGNLAHHKLIEHKSKYVFDTMAFGIAEDERLDFYSPYGCSKGAADQYVKDYSRIYGLHTTVARQSCIYGEFQDGTEDQGWVAWFVKAFINNIPLSIYGNGKQVRDILYIKDLVDFYGLVIENGQPGEVYNVGGSFKNSISLLELIIVLENRFGSKPAISFLGERQGDQKIFISDNTKAEKNLNWTVKTGIDEGLTNLIDYLIQEDKV